MADQTVHFVPVEAIAERTAAAFAAISVEVAALLPDASIEEIGATSVPGALTKGDLDVLVRVEPDDFATATKTLEAHLSIHQPENWTDTFASFNAPPHDGIPVGVQLAPAGSQDDRDLRRLRDLFRARPDLLARLNDLKRAHEGADPETYWRAKDELIQTLLAADNPR